MDFPGRFAPTRLLPTIYPSTQLTRPIRITHHRQGSLSATVLVRTARHSQNSTVLPDSHIELTGHVANNEPMSDSTPPDLFTLAALLLQNERSFVVRRYVQRFLAGEMTAREAIARIRENPGMTDNVSYPEE